VKRFGDEETSDMLALHEQSIGGSDRYESTARRRHFYCLGDDGMGLDGNGELMLGSWSVLIVAVVAGVSDCRLFDDEKSSIHRGNKDHTYTEFIIMIIIIDRLLETQD
jgi:hypothetical protein